MHKGRAEYVKAVYSVLRMGDEEEERESERKLKREHIL